MLREETIIPETLDLIKRLQADAAFKDFVLVGGTALALQIGHRRSIDIDLFTDKPFDTKQLSEHILATYQTERLSVTPRNLFVFIEGVKMDLIDHGHPMIKPPLETDGLRIASLDDITAMKLLAVYQSGERVKDFIDIYHLLEHRNFNSMLKSYAEKYPENDPYLAKMAVLFHKQIDYNWDMSVLKRSFNKKEMKQRLRHSVLFPDKIFEKISQDKKKTQQLRKRR